MKLKNDHRSKFQFKQLELKKKPDDHSLISDLQPQFKYELFSYTSHHDFINCKKKKKKTNEKVIQSLEAIMMILQFHRLGHKGLFLCGSILALV